MSWLKWSVCLSLAFALVATIALAGDAGAAKRVAIASMDLSKPFGTRSPWLFIATQGLAVSDPVMGSVTGEKVPGEIVVCLRRRNGPCDPSLQATLRPLSSGDLFLIPHFLGAAQIVHLHGAKGRALFLLRMASVLSGDGDQLVRTQVLAYHSTSDSFARVYDFTTGRNNNQEVRYIASGRLKGDVVSVVPTEIAPYGFWVTVNALAPDYSYRPILKYRSTTRYGDGNALAVIDSEMPNIEQRLGLWRPGAPLPLPAGPCPRPHLSRMELWCK